MIEAGIYLWHVNLLLLRLVAAVVLYIKIFPFFWLLFHWPRIKY